MDAVLAAPARQSSLRATFSPKLLVLGALFVAFLVVQGPLLVPDSGTYVEAWPTRPPVLPLVLLGGNALVGARAALYLTVVLQSVAAFVSCRVLLVELERVVSHVPTASAIGFFALLMPQFKAARTIASESLAYSFVCLFAAAIAGALVTRASNRRVWLGVAAACAAYATRAQFIYLVPLALLGAAAVVAFARTSTKSRVVLGAGAIAVLALTLTINATYLRIRSGRPGGVPLSGVQLIALVSHVASRSEVEAANLGKDREFAERVYDRLEANHMLASQRDPNVGVSAFLADRYNPILDVVGEEFRALQPKPALNSARYLWGMTVEQLCELDRTTKRVGLTLLHTSWKRYLRVSVTSIWEWHRYFCIVMLFNLVLAIGTLVRNPRVLPSWLLLAVTGGWLANVCVVALVEPPLYRYTFYYDAIFVALLCLLVGRTLTPAANRASN